MHKKIIALIVIIALAGVVGISAVIVGTNTLKKPNQPWQKVRVADDNLYSDEGYVDYAEMVYLDADIYPDTAEMGLFWTKWDEETKSIVEVPAGTKEGAALVDPSKPTIINVHGMLTNGYYWQETYSLHGGVAAQVARTDFDLDMDKVPLNYLWIREGWNVGNFHYNRFAAEGMEAWNIEGKIWGTETKDLSGNDVGMRYKQEDGTFVYGAIDYSISEFFAAEYIRAMRLLPTTMGKEEIRFAAHSMGGELTAATIFLLTELADHGQLSPTLLPDRYALLDAFFGIEIDVGNEKVIVGPNNASIHWSNKPLVDGKTGTTMLECLKDLVANGIALEYYTFTQSTLIIAMAPIIEEFYTLATYTMHKPDWGHYSSGFNLTMDGHNAIRDWYYCSIYSPVPKDITNPDDPRPAPSAKTPTSVIRGLKGSYYRFHSGEKTVTAEDDLFTREQK